MLTAKQPISRKPLSGQSAVAKWRLTVAAGLTGGLLLSTALLARTAQGQTAQPVEIVIPSKLVAGEPATLTALDAAGRLVPRTDITFSDGSHTETDVNGLAHMTAPSAPGAIIARVTLHPEVTACTAVLPHAIAAKLEVASFPPVVSIHDPFEIKGAGFSGDSRADRVTFHDQLASVLAASPVSLVVLLDYKSEPGTWKLDIAANGVETWFALAAVSVEFALATEHLVPGTKTKLTARVRGTDKSETLEIKDLAPDVLAFSHNTSEQLRTRGGVDNSTSVDVRALRAGDYSFRVRILSSDAGAADIEAAHAYLEGALKIATPQWKHRLDPLVAQLERPKVKVPQIVDRLEKMMPEAPQGDLAILLAAAGNALRGR